MSLNPDQPSPSSKNPDLQALPGLGSNGRSAPKGPLWAEWLGELGESKTLHLITFSRNVAMMLEAGQSLDKVLNTQAQRAPGPKLRRAIEQLRDEMAAGHSFAEALANNEAYFGPQYVGLLSAGDATGKLTLALQKAVESLEWGMQIRKKIRVMAIYPIVITSVLVVDFIVFIGIVLPMILDAMKDAIDASAPAWLHITLWVAHGGWLYFIGALFAVTYSSWFFLTQTPVGKRLCEETAISVPLVCDVAYYVQASYFLMNVLMAYSAGLTLGLAVNLGIKSMTNEVIREQFDEVERTLNRQGSLTKALQETGAIPVDVMEMIATGEETGSLEKMLTLSLQYLGRELDDKIELLMNIAKPVTLVIMVVLFGAVFMGMYTVIFSAFGALLDQTLKGILPPTGS